MAYGLFVLPILIMSIFIPEDQPPEWRIAIFPFFFVVMIVIFACTAVYWQEMRDMGLTKAEQRRWMLIWFVLPPAALTGYWWHYVHSSRTGGTTA